MRSNSTGQTTWRKLVWLPIGFHAYIEYLEASDIATFKRWIECYINNWAKCDSFCNHTIGDLIVKCPEIVG